MSKRILKKPDVRRLEIIQKAEMLFARDGYSKTSVEAIIQEAGIAKGTFYYYFKAKQDVLEALVDLQGLEMETLFQSILQNEKLPAIDKLEQMLKGPEKEARTKKAVMQLIHKPENRELQEKLNIFSVKKIAPLLTGVFAQGHQEGVFPRFISEEIVQLLLAGSHFTMESGLFNWSRKKQTTFLQALQELLELLTGVKKGSLSFISKAKK